MVHFLNEVERVGHPRSLPHLLHSAPLPAPPYVLVYGGGEQHRLLRHHPDLLPQLHHVQLGDVHPSYLDFAPLCGLISFEGV